MILIKRLPLIVLAACFFCFGFNCMFSKHNVNDTMTFGPYRGATLSFPRMYYSGATILPDYTRAAIYYYDSSRKMDCVKYYPFEEAYSFLWNNWKYKEPDDLVKLLDLTVYWIAAPVQKALPWILGGNVSSDKLNTNRNNDQYLPWYKACFPWLLDSIKSSLNDFSGTRIGKAIITSAISTFILFLLLYLFWFSRHVWPRIIRLWNDFFKIDPYRSKKEEQDIENIKYKDIKFDINKKLRKYE